MSYSPGGTLGFQSQGSECFDMMDAIAGRCAWLQSSQPKDKRVPRTR